MRYGQKVRCREIFLICLVWETVHTISCLHQEPRVRLDLKRDTPRFIARKVETITYGEIRLFQGIGTKGAPVASTRKLVRATTVAVTYVR